MYRGSIPQSSNIFWRRCAPLYIAKLQDKALCRLNTRLQKEFTRENIKLKISGKSVVRAWRNRGKFTPRMGCANLEGVVRVLCEFCTSFAQAEGVVWVLWEFHTSFAQAEGVVRISRCCTNFAQAWSSCLLKAISSSFQLQLVHGLKLWILDFLSFEMVYRM